MEDPASELFIKKKKDKIPYKDLYIANIILLVLTILFTATALGFMGWAIFEQVSYNQCTGDIDDVYEKIQRANHTLHVAEQNLIKCETIDCPVPVCYSCCPPCTNYSGIIYVTGNSTLILPGSTTTNSNDFTNFGNVSTSAYVERVFVINNNDTSLLRVTGRNISPGPGMYIVPVGGSSGTFAITQYQISVPVAYTGQLLDLTSSTPASITIRFTANTNLGNTVSLVQIGSSDPVIPLYTFYLSVSVVP